jgi:hypothetical protein
MISVFAPLPQLHALVQLAYPKSLSSPTPSLLAPLTTET